MVAIAMIRKIFVGLSIVLITVVVGQANAAFISANAELDQISIGEETTIDIILELGLTEEASVFEGRFNLFGLGVIASVDLEPGGPSWTSGVGNINDSQVILSLTSDNQGGDRLVASMLLTGLNPGTFEVILDDPTFASFDIDDPPYLQDIGITNTSGDVLASVNVVPIPGTLFLLAPALGILACNRKRKKS
jgi:hypothetical protein